jgi:hypothetical protein
MQCDIMHEEQIIYKESRAIIDAHRKVILSKYRPFTKQ